MSRISCHLRSRSLLLLLTLTLCQKSVLGNTQYEKDVVLTVQDKEILDEFKAIVVPHLRDDYMKEEMFLIRWLRAKKFDLDVAANALLKNLDWRATNRMDGILEEDWTDMANDFRYYIQSVDREGKPTVYFSADGLDIRQGVLGGKEERLLRYIDKAMEEVTTVIRRVGKEKRNVTRGQLIIDFNGYNLVQHGCLRCIPVILRGVSAYENHYPEYLEYIFLMNTPSIAEPLINAAKGLLTESTRNSLKVMGTNKAANLDTLLQVFDRDEIPEQLGGRKVYKGSDSDYDEYGGPNSFNNN